MKSDPSKDRDFAAPWFDKLTMNGGNRLTRFIGETLDFRSELTMSGT